MGNELIRDVIRFEEELSRNLAAEEEKIRLWLEEVGSNLDYEHRQQALALKDGTEQALASARLAAENEAGELLEEAERRAAELENLDDSLLKAIIGKHLSAILPGESDDHPDVEG